MKFKLGGVKWRRVGQGGARLNTIIIIVQNYSARKMHEKKNQIKLK